MLENPDSRRVQLPTNGLEARSAWTSATGALDLKKLLISGWRAGTAENPRHPQMRKDRGTQLPPRMA
jgi:hypothetical protein